MKNCRALLCLLLLPSLLSCGSNEKTDDKVVVSFETYGGTSFSSQVIKSGERVIDPGAPLLEGYSFYGFFLKDGFENNDWGNRFSFDEKIYESLTLYAKLIKDIRYNASFFDGDQLVGTIENIVPGSLIGPILPEEKEDRLFVGYTVKGEENVFDFQTPIEKDYEFVAKWSNKASIALDYGEATHEIGPASISLPKGEPYKLPRPYKNDASFLGWFTPEEELFPLEGILNCDALALHAKFKDGKGDISYFDNGVFLKVISSKSATGEILIPEWHDGKKVKEISEGAFAENANITKLEISEGITDIGKRSFYATGLAEVKLPSSLLIIGEEAFASCKNLSSIDFKEGIEYIGLRSFFSCTSLSYVEFPSSLLEFRGGAFNECSSLKRAVFKRSLSEQGSVTKPNITNRADFRNLHPGFVIECPADSLAQYKEMFATQYAWNDKKTADDYIVSNDQYTDGLYIKNGTLLDVKTEEEILNLGSDVCAFGPGCFYLSGARIISTEAVTLNASCFLGSKVNSITFQTEEAIRIESFSYGGKTYSNAFTSQMDVVVSYLTNKYTNSQVFKNANKTVVCKEVAVTYFVGGTQYASYSITQGQPFIEPAAPSSEGKSFCGWYTKDGTAEDWGKKIDFATDVVEKEISLFARFEQSYSISVNYNGAFLKGEETISVCDGDAYQLIKPGKNDSIFVGYFKDGQPFPMSGVFEFGGDIEIEAVFKSASSNLSFASATIGSNVGLSVSKGTFSGTALVIPEYHDNTKVISVAQEGFRGSSSLESIELNDNIVQLAARCFRECTKLTEFDIPSSVESVLAGSFYGDSSLTKGTLHRAVSKGITTCGNDSVLYGVDPSFVLYVPKDSVTKYSESKWGQQTSPQITIVGMEE